MTKKPDMEDEKDLFHTAMSGVKKLPSNNKADLRPKPPKPRVKRQVQKDDDMMVALSDHEYLEPLSSAALVEYKRDGLQHKVLRKMRAGQYNTEAILDMHGMTVATAKETLFDFLTACQRNGICHVLIIHGKGSTSGNPILKNKLNHWLRALAQVLAFCSATARDGRSGAMYVLLKNSKGEQHK
jgi:DNA-nicking Smr family endonuclease